MVILWNTPGTSAIVNDFLSKTSNAIYIPRLCGALLRHRTRHNLYFEFRSEGRQPYLVCPRTDLDVAL
jgi:hypothetical protein